MPTVRPATLDDAPAIAAVVAACSPYLVQDAVSTAYEMRHEPAGVTRLVAEVDGEVVAVSRLDIAPDEEPLLQLMVHPDHRRHAVGGALLEAQLDVLRRQGRDSVRSVVEDDDESRAAAQAWGFVLTRRFAMAMVDPRTVVAAAPPAGVEVRPLDGLPPRVIWHALSAVVRDDPSGLSQPTTFEEFQDEWADPRRRSGLGRAVLVDGELAALTVVGVAGDRAWSDMTGTLPSYRGRGYALLAKQHALAAAAAAGVTRAMAGNDDNNLPMVTVNRRLGYAVFARPALGERPVTATAKSNQPRRAASTPAWKRLAAPSSVMISAIIRRTVRVETSSRRAAASSVSPVAARRTSAWATDPSTATSRCLAVPSGSAPRHSSSKYSTSVSTIAGTRISTAPSEGRPTSQGRKATDRSTMTMRTGTLGAVRTSPPSSVISRA